MEFVTAIRPLEIDQSGQRFEVTLKGGLSGTRTIIVGEKEIADYWWDGHQSCWQTLLE
jgi:hypothetical protein